MQAVRNLWRKERKEGKKLKKECKEREKERRKRGKKERKEDRKKGRKTEDERKKDPHVFYFFDTSRKKRASAIRKNPGFHKRFLKPGFFGLLRMSFLRVSAIKSKPIFFYVKF